MALSVEVKIKLFPAMKLLTNPSKVRAAIKKHYARAAKIVGMAISANMRKVIQAGVAPVNRPFTASIKGSTKPLVGAGPGARLWKSITYKVAGGFSTTVYVGVMRTHAKANVARIVHEGASITVTPRMALLFKVLHNITVNGKGKATSPRAQELLADAKGPIPALKVGTVLTMPPRKFATLTYNDPKTRHIVEATYTQALQAAMKELTG